MLRAFLYLLALFTERDDRQANPHTRQDGTTICQPGFVLHGKVETGGTDRTAIQHMRENGTRLAHAAMARGHNGAQGHQTEQSLPKHRMLIGVSNADEESPNSDKYDGCEGVRFPPCPLRSLRCLGGHRLRWLLIHRPLLRSIVKPRL